MMNTYTPASCPVTGAPGRPVPEETVLALAPGMAPDDLRGRRWHYCADLGCDTVYFDDEGRTIEKSQVNVRVGEKEADAPHTVCYCFNHTVEEIEQDIARDGTTGIPDAIKAKVQAGKCSCEVMNPKGTCCLGDVATEVKRAMSVERSDASNPATSDESCSATGPGDACCAVPGGASTAPPSETPRRATLAAIGLSALTALGASACCWLPLLLAVLGASSVGVAATFEGMRPYLLVIAPLFLGFSFYMLYLRKSPCADDSTCATQRGGGSRVAKVFFWIAAGLLVFSLAFPSAMAALLGGSEPTSSERLATLPTLELRVTGMTCESCSAQARAALMTVAGVEDAAADHERGTARVWFEEVLKPDHAALRRVLAEHGYEVGMIEERQPQDGTR